jgi:hypothetical protein
MKQYCFFKKGVYFALLFLFIGCMPTIMSAQQPKPSAPNRAEGYKWRKWALHTGAGFQKAFFAEIGPSYVYHEFDAESLMAGSIIGYGAFEWSPTEKIYGGKIGCDLVTMIIDYGIEFKYLTDNKTSDYIFTPKAGLGLGFVNIVYGYSFSVNKYPFPNIGKHQVALTFNLTKRFFNKHTQS